MKRSFRAAIGGALVGIAALVPCGASAQGHLFFDNFQRTTGLGPSWQVAYGGFTTNGTYAVSGSPPVNGNWARAVPNPDYTVSADITIPAGSLYSGLFARSSDPVDFDSTLYAAQISTDGTVDLYRRNGWAWVLLAPAVPAGIQPNIKYSLKLVVSGNSPVHLEVWLNGVKKIAVDDSSAGQIADGVAGIMNYDAGVAYTNFAISYGTGTIFSDTFQRTSGLGSKWSVLYGSFSTDGTRAVSGAPPGNGNWARVVPQFGTDDLAVSANLVIPPGSQYSGLVTRSNDPNGFDAKLYAAQLSTDGAVRLYRRNGWNWTQLGPAVANGIVANVSYALKLVATGYDPAVHLEVWVNGARLISYDDRDTLNHIATGSAGIENYDTNVKYSNFAVDAATTTGYSVAATVTGSGSVTSSPAGISCPAGACSMSVAPGSVVALTATPATGYTFAGWGGACTGTGTCNLTVNSASSVTAQFVPSPQTVTVSLAGSGSVTSSPAGLTCSGTSCSMTVAYGTAVALTATPAAGYTFLGWSGACSGTGTCNLTANSNLSVTAQFATTSETLSVSLSGSGTVTSTPAGLACSGTSCSMNVPYNTAVSLSATPATGYTFAGWSGACSGTGACSVTLTSNKSVTATFTPSPQTVTVSLAGSGSVTSSPAGLTCSGTSCSMTVAYGTAVVLTATPAAGYTFLGWSGACSGTGTCNLTANSNLSVTAQFATTSETLSVSISGSGTIASNPSGLTCSGTSCSMNVPYNTAVSLTATPATGYTFTGWSGACTGTGACGVTLKSNTSVTATFTPTRTVTVTLAGSGSVASNPPGLSCSGTSCTMTVASGAAVSLTATPATGNVFFGWSGACTGTGACNLSVTSNLSVSAKFILRNSYTVSVAVVGTGSVTSNPPGINCVTGGQTGACLYSFDGGTNVTLTAQPAPGLAFTGWSDGCSGTGACQLNNLSANTSVNAIFQSYPCGDHMCARGEFPPASWHPYAIGSAFNMAVPANPPLVSNSAAIVANILGTGSTKKQPANLGVASDHSGGWPTYWSTSADRWVGFACNGAGGCDLAAKNMHGYAPVDALVQDNDPTTGDRHMTIMDQTTNTEYDLFGVSTSPVTTATTIIQTLWSGYTGINGDGRAIGLGQGNDGRIGNLAGRIRWEELKYAIEHDSDDTQNYIKHALTIAIGCVAPTPVYPADPAKKPTKVCSWTDAPALGSRLWLEKPISDINTLNVPAWKKVLLRTLVKYGAIINDTDNSGFYFAWQRESGNQYTSMGQNDDPWLLFGQTQTGTINPTTGQPYGCWDGDPSTDFGVDCSGVNGTFSGYFGSWANTKGTTRDGGLDWGTIWSNLRMLDPCVSLENPNSPGKPSCP